MKDTVIQYLFSAIAAVIALTVHEFSHGYAAYKLGDPTAKERGRLSLNPFSHLDLWGTLCLVVCHFGWAKPVPIDTRYFKKPKRDFALTAMAGPGSNLLLAFFSTFFLLLTYKWYFSVLLAGESETLLNVAYYTLQFVGIFVSVNLGLAVFNLLPVPPLDGSRLLCAFLPDKLYYKILRYERIIYWFIIGWLFFGRFVSNFLLNIPAVAESAALTTVANILSLSGLLSKLISLISQGMIYLWSLLPFLQ